jgi:DNA-binding LacI/PurR family transcriptional regulator
MVTLAEVARHAGVSSSTVSYVLSGKRTISEETRRRVERSIAELGYYRHAGARALASNKSNVVALMLPLRGDLYMPVMAEITIAVTTTARRFGYDVLLMTSDEGPAGVRRVTGSGLADALVLLDIALDDERIPAVRDTKQPAVLIGVPADPSGLSCVDLDFAAAGTMCAHDLADLGHREVALIGSASGVYRRHTGFAERTLSGFRAAATERGLRFVHRPCEGDYTSTAGTVARIFEERPGTTGIVVQNERALVHLPGLLRQSGRAVPEDVSVLAICGREAAEHAFPPITGVPIPAAEMGRQAVELAVSIMDGGQADRTVLLPPELVERQSSGPAAG